MKKMFYLVLLLVTVFSAAACGTKQQEVIVSEMPEVVTMATIDSIVHRDDVQLVDLRNFDDQFRAGWIRGFELIPFFAYLEYEQILVRDSGWTFSPSNIKDENALRNLFDKDLNIVLICAAGARAGYVREALLHLGYENVWNAGALGDYQGTRMVYGDAQFSFSMPPRSNRLPLPTTIEMANIDQYVTRPNMQFVDLRNFGNMTTDGWHSAFTVVPFFEFLEAQEVLVRSNGWTFSPEDIKNEAVLRNIFDADANIVLICAAGARAGYVREALLHLGYENVWNAGALNTYSGPNLIQPWACDDTETPAPICE